ncbi:TPA: hypothetical protein WGR75_001012 [Neisseria meningitidis]|uniref:hypothetical protein n=1 Tax=Neisseria meningitidis TaxID=487 RepID=UPI0013E07CD2|nr:hypothetical protein [Neisseria meningitidis]MCL4978852.1 hypothetical protein [Neisseria meningitidis]MCL4999020.1 hypothetical protein [Neisseria meningitidis]MCL5764063.1 hypothetical protein [Neisseria meningitidis]MCL5864938.1 hypothetical protein [Neisseria meningitidis]MCL6138082.1 hypothetical protein [Neisseria meningitidis]
MPTGLDSRLRGNDGIFFAFDIKGRLNFVQQVQSVAHKRAQASSVKSAQDRGKAGVGRAVATVFFTPSGKNTKTQIKPFGGSSKNGTSQQKYRLSGF